MKNFCTGFQGVEYYDKRQEEYVMPSRLIIDGNSVYEVDEDCEKSRMGNGRKQPERARTENGTQMKRQEEAKEEREAGKRE